MKNGLTIDKWGTYEWYRNGQRHREDGPAVIYPSGIKIWYQNGVFITDTEQVFKDYIILQNLKSLL